MPVAVPYLELVTFVSKIILTSPSCQFRALTHRTCSLNSEIRNFGINKRRENASRHIISEDRDRYGS